MQKVRIYVNNISKIKTQAPLLPGAKNVEFMLEKRERYVLFNRTVSLDEF